MATIQSIQSGPLSDAATWSGGVVPVSTDDIIISAGHAVTLDADFICSASITNNGTLSINMDINLTLGSGTNAANALAGTYTFGQGSILTGAGSVLVKCGRILSAATPLNWAYVGGTIAFKDPGASPRFFSEWNLRYVSINTPLTAQVFSIGSTASTNGPAAKLNIQRNCFRNTASIDFAYSSYFNVNTDVVINNNDFRNCGQIAVNGPSTTATPEGVLREFKGNTLYSASGQKILRLVLYGPWNFDGMVSINYVSNLSRDSDTYIDCFLSTDQVATPQVLFNARNGSRGYKCYIHNPDISPANSNPHLASIAELYDSVFEIPGSEPNAHIADNAHTELVTEGCLMIGTGDLVNNATNTPRKWRTKNNTIVTRSTGVTNALALAETQSLVPLDEGMVARNNLHVCLAETQGQSYMFRTVGAAVQLPVDADYNAQYNMAGFFGSQYNATNTNEDDGIHNIIISNPQFVDPARNLITWGRLRTGNASAGYLDAYDYLLSRNGYDASTGTQKAELVAAYTATDLIDWVREGYRPQNMELATSGEDGSHIGILAPAGGEVTEFDTHATANEKYLPGGTTPNATALRQIVDIPSGWTVENVKSNGSYGTFSHVGDIWYYILNRGYKHDSGGGTAVDADTAFLNLTGAEDAVGLLSVHINIISDITVITAPSSISGATEASGTYSVNFGANAPGEVSWEDANGTGHDAGDTATFDDYTVTVDSDGGITATLTSTEEGASVSAYIELIGVDAEDTPKTRRVSIRLGSGGDRPKWFRPSFICPAFS